MIEVTRPHFTVSNSKGAVLALYCKVCGRQIADFANGGYTAKYIEAKIQCDDGSFHVTNGCDTCITKDLSSEDLDALIATDMAEQGVAPEKRRAVEVVQLGRGIP